MTTATASTPQRALGWAAAAGTVPYLTIKVNWLSGNPVGLTTPAFVAEPAVAALNAVTLAMDAVVIVLALALTHPWGHRLAGWLVLLPTWIGTGFLVPMALAIMPATVLATVTGAGAGDAVLEPWVRPVVYGGFAWQGVFLVAAFVGYAHRRWSAVVDVPAAPSLALAPVLRVVTAGGVVMAVLSSGLHAAVAATAGDAATAGVQVITAALPLIGAAGVVALVRGRPRRRWFAAAAAWTGSSAMFSWGLWAAATTMVGGPLGGSGAAAAPAAGLAQLTGLLGGFALAVAGLLALAGTGVAQPAPAADRSWGRR